MQLTLCLRRKDGNGSVYATVVVFVFGTLGNLLVWLVLRGSCPWWVVNIGLSLAGCAIMVCKDAFYLRCLRLAFFCVLLGGGVQGLFTVSVQIVHSYFDTEKARNASVAFLQILYGSGGVFWAVVYGRLREPRFGAFFPALDTQRGCNYGLSIFYLRPRGVAMPLLPRPFSSAFVLANGAAADERTPLRADKAGKDSVIDTRC